MRATPPDLLELVRNIKVKDAGDFSFRRVSEEEVRRAILSFDHARALGDLWPNKLPRRHFAHLDFGAVFETVSESSTARSTIGLKCPANQCVETWGIDIGFDGTTSTNGPAIVEVCSCTWATNSPGTNSTSITLVAFDSGRPETIQSTAAKAWTAGNEPTVLTVMRAFDVPSYMGSGIIPLPIMKPFLSKGGNGIVLRITMPSTVTANATGTLNCTE